MKTMQLLHTPASPLALGAFIIPFAARATTLILSVVRAFTRRDGRY
jgi:hypothetical protein